MVSHSAQVWSSHKPDRLGQVEDGVDEEADPSQPQLRHRDAGKPGDTPLCRSSASGSRLSARSQVLSVSATSWCDKDHDEEAGGGRSARSSAAPDAAIRRRVSGVMRLGDEQAMRYRHLVRGGGHRGPSGRCGDCRLFGQRLAWIRLDVSVMAHSGLAGRGLAWQRSPPLSGRPWTGFYRYQSGRCWTIGGRDRDRRARPGVTALLAGRYRRRAPACAGPAMVPQCRPGHAHGRPWPWRDSLPWPPCSKRDWPPAGRCVRRRPGACRDGRPPP
jgi:hypothetical protein